MLDACEQRGTIRAPDVHDIVEAHELTGLEHEALVRELDKRGIEIVEAKPVERAPVAPTPVESTTDALQLFLREAGRHRLLTAAQEVSLAKRIERGDAGAKEEMIQANLRLVVSIAKNYRNQGLPVPRPDPGGHARSHPRGREVRLAARLQVLDVRDVVDPPGGRPRARRQGAHDPDAGPHRGTAPEDQPGGAVALGPARARADARGDRRRGVAHARAGARGARRRARFDEPRRARRRRRRRDARRLRRRRRAAARGGGRRAAPASGPARRARCRSPTASARS